MSKIREKTVDMDAPWWMCTSCGGDLEPTLINQAMCHKCVDRWNERRRLAEKAVIQLTAELSRLKTMETEISVLVAEGSNGGDHAEYLLECMENMLVGGPYERKWPEDCICVGDDDDKGRPIVTVTHKGVEYVGRIGLGGRVVSFPTDVPARVHAIVHEYFRAPVGEMNWDLIA